MKNFQQNLLIVLALSLCGLCVYQWYSQTIERTQIEDLNKLLYQKSAAIQDYTNSIVTMNSQIAQMDARLTELKATVKTNEQVIASQKLEINGLRFDNQGLTNSVAEYKTAVEALEARLKEVGEGVKKQNEAIEKLVAQRDELAKKYNDEVADRNAVVAKYNDLVAQVEKMQKGAAKQ
jgi:chromosome segregation ATPase